MNRPRTADLTKLQVVCSLFKPLIGDDLYLARQIKESIETALSEKAGTTDEFLFKARELSSNLEIDSPDESVRHIDLSDSPFSMLCLRAKLLTAIKGLCRFGQSTLLLSGLKEALCPTGRRWSPKKAQDYQDAIAFARDFCQQRSLPRSQINLVIY
ncbi:MAG: hypothetical protein F6K21_14420 [Symploca sp. SIO2D2]|nr:hypothetical protein [Symploca sp. SIO2D2]